MPIHFSYSPIHSFCSVTKINLSPNQSVSWSGLGFCLFTSAIRLVLESVGYFVILLSLDAGFVLWETWLIHWGIWPLHLKIWLMNWETKFPGTDWRRKLHISPSLFPFVPSLVSATLPSLITTLVSPASPDLVMFLTVSIQFVSFTTDMFPAGILMLKLRITAYVWPFSAACFISAISPTIYWSILVAYSPNCTYCPVLSFTTLPYSSLIYAWLTLVSPSLYLHYLLSFGTNFSNVKVVWVLTLKEKVSFHSLFSPHPCPISHSWW